MILRPSASFTKKDGSKQDADTVFGQCLCIDWSVIDGGKWIVGGYSSGLIALWRLFEPSQLLFSQESEFGEEWCFFPLHSLFDMIFCLKNQNRKS